MNRSQMREQAFVLLFEKEFFKDKSCKEIEEIYNENMAELSDYAIDVFEGTVLHTDELDEIIKEFSNGWSIKRIPKVNLAILRLALYEMKYVDGVPLAVVANEAVELAKKYSGAEDFAFVNGILSSYSRSL